MKVVLHKITKREDGLIDLVVSLGDDPSKTYRAGCYERSQGSFVDQELFMTLSDLAYKRFGNCVVYQIELMKILMAFDEGDETPEMPAELGSNSFCTIRPGRLRIAWNKFTIFLRRLGVLRLRIWTHPDGK